MFLEGADIIRRYANVTFKEYNEILPYNLKDTLEELGINQDWKSQSQVMIDQRRKQLE